MGERTTGRDSRREAEQRRDIRLAQVDQLKTIYKLVQRELIRAGAIPGPPRDGWTLEDAYPVPRVAAEPGTVPLRGFVPGTLVDPDVPPDSDVLTTDTTDPLPPDAHDTAVAQLVGRPAVVLGGALKVQQAFELSDGFLMDGLKRVRKYAAASAEIDSWLLDNGERFANVLRTAALCDRVETYGTDTPGLDFDELCQLLNYAVVGAANRAAAARTFAENIERRVLTLIQLYEQERRAASMHLIMELNEKGLDESHIADVLDELPDKAGYECEMDWEDDCEKAKQAVYRRVQRAKSKLQHERMTRVGPPRVPLERQTLVLFCRHVPEGRPISIHLRSGGAVQDPGGQRSPLDPNGATDQHSPGP